MAQVSGGPHHPCMRASILVLAGIIAGATPTAALISQPRLAARRTAPTAADVVRRALDAIGGEARWRAVHTLHLEVHTENNSVGDSDWFDGPYANFFSVAGQWRDLDGGRRSVQGVSIGIDDAGRKLGRTITAGGSTITVVDRGGTPTAVARIAADSLDFLLSTERVLLTALAAGDLRLERDTTMRLVRHHVVSFHIGRTPVRLFFEAETGFPRMIEAVRVFPKDMFWNAWGDVTERVRFTNWDIAETGVLYPTHIAIERNGRPVQSIRYASIRINQTPPAGTFDVPPNAATLPCGFSCFDADSIPLGWGSGPGGNASPPSSGAHEIAPGIVQIVGGWNSTIVRQPDGLVIIEAPMSAGYSARVLAESARRFPGVRVKGVVTTTDYWWHHAGLREYIARGIPVYVLDHNVRVVEARARAPHTLRPDSLARAPRAPIIRPVVGRMTIGSGANRIDLIPYRSGSLDRMMMAWLPGVRIVYTAEGVQIYGGNVVNPQYLRETVAAVAREKLSPERLIGMHMPSTPWTVVTAAADSIDRSASRP
jgi:hypothetical protein